MKSPTTGAHKNLVKILFKSTRREHQTETDTKDFF